MIAFRLISHCFAACRLRRTRYLALINLAREDINSWLAMADGSLRLTLASESVIRCLF